ncbi:permease [Streptococcaceae bacterium ESL0687]|nr:permease [Streptococcaceae bacterium ESL0687]
MFSNLPYGVLQCATIFMSIVIEALPFVLMGSIISGFLEVFLTADLIKKLLPSNKILRVLFGIFFGFFFPSCECGIVPVISRLMNKGVPSYTALPFMVAAPVINPIVIFAGYIAFGNSTHLVLLRTLGIILVAFLLGLFLIYVYQKSPLKEKDIESDDYTHDHNHSHDLKNIKGSHKIWLALNHSIDEFFDTGKYLIIGASLASFLQIYLPTTFITSLNHNKLLGILVMMLLALIMSLCSEADAFVGASFLGLFGPAPVLAFLLLGPVVDIKNLLMMSRYFKPAFIAQFIALVSLTIIIFTEFFV